MKKYIIIFLVFTLSNLIYSQEFDLNLMKKLTKISFFSADDFMIEGYGFEKIREENDGLKLVYARHYNNDWDNTIIISILSSKPIQKEMNGLKYFYRKPNVLDIKVAQNYNIRVIKDSILSRGFEYIDSPLAGFTAYEKEKYTYLIGKEPNKEGGTQIMLITD